ncbi:hypothetical protein TEA_007199 [Camellia sinensis var. sinensis]|uniref:Ternary complex factor MIP1 leucine-zipper domain-containing protein n=1 Tax=Camellia sinensis var. sinensis TaxID=542762 RepID=A0A4S4ESS2_CAMSN|nr:hypothetical protein TEA_007199 [Camellia sinensis var. sinensis]
MKMKRQLVVVGEKMEILAQFRISMPNTGSLRGALLSFLYCLPGVLMENILVSELTCFGLLAVFATERNLDNPRGGVSHPIQNDFTESHELQPSESTCGAQSPLLEYSINTNTDNASSHRASLEKDIEQLQLRLQQEKSLRMVLERAMGRVSSTLSPGHRHFVAQTKELIAEIELLEEEVANREQHVLSLYRSIFEHCVSRPPSEQCSGMTSPAHVKNESRKHPSVISSAFCSSKKFPLRPFQALASANDAGKRTLLLQSKARHASLLSSKSNNQFERTWSDHRKGQELLPTMEKTSVLRTLKDHLYQCPSKLSEEMVRCMAAVYCWLCSSASESIEQKQNRSPLLSRSSTNVVLPGRGISDDRDWSCKSMVEISSISTDQNNFTRASYAIDNYRVSERRRRKKRSRQGKGVCDKKGVTVDGGFSNLKTLDLKSRVLREGEEEEEERVGGRGAWCVAVVEVEGLLVVAAATTEGAEWLGGGIGGRGKTREWQEG